MRIILIGAILLVCIFLLFGCTATGPTAAVKTKFSTSPYAKTSYKVAPGIVELLARETLGKTNVMDSLLQDGTDQITITGTTISIKNPFILSKGSSLYFSDNNPGDDIGGEERDSTDDIFIIVSPDGYITQIITTQ